MATTDDGGRVSGSGADERIERLMELFPEAVRAGGIDFGTLRSLVGDDVPRAGSYGFIWPGKDEAVRLARATCDVTLHPRPERSVSWDTTENLYLEGDNLDALKALVPTHRGLVDVMVIDPPYNTGATRLYRDNFSETRASYQQKTVPEDDEDAETSGRLHAAWCSFMYPRLCVARELLSEDGVLFVFLNDREHARTRLMLDEIFGEQNYVTEFVWEKKKKPSFLHRHVGRIFDYVLCYARNAERVPAFSVETTTRGKRYPLNNAGNGLSVLTFAPGSVSFACEDGLYRAQDMSSGNVITRLLDDVVVERGRNATAMRLEGEWRYSQGRLDQVIAVGEPITISKVPFRPNHIKTGGERKMMKNMLSPTHYGCGTNEDASKHIVELFGAPVFDTPKPADVIELLVRAVTYQKPQALVMDFFAGSSTTGEAVWRANRHDGGARRFILVQLAEPCATDSVAYRMGYRDLCEVGEERLRRSMDPASPHDEGFRVYEVRASGQQSRDHSKRD